MGLLLLGGGGRAGAGCFGWVPGGSREVAEGWTGSAALSQVPGGSRRFRAGSGQVPKVPKVPGMFRKVVVEVPSKVPAGSVGVPTGSQRAPDGGGS